MPIYTYRCAACDTQFERLVRGSDAVTCPECSHRFAVDLSGGRLGES